MKQIEQAGGYADADADADADVGKRVGRQLKMVDVVQDDKGAVAS